MGGWVGGWMGVWVDGWGGRGNGHTPIHRSPERVGPSSCFFFSRTRTRCAHQGASVWDGASTPQSPHSHKSQGDDHGYPVGRHFLDLSHFTPPHVPCKQGMHMAWL